MTGVDRPFDDHGLALRAPGIDERPPTTIVIGAGIVGLSIAYRLQTDGGDVLVLDRDGVGAGASHRCTPGGHWQP